MAATGKAELLALTEAEYAKLIRTLDAIDRRMATAPGPEDGISIKDTIAHRVHWIELFFGWVRTGRSGLPVHTPAEGYKWNQLKAYNAKVRAASRDKDWPTVLAELRNAHARLLALLSDAPEEELYGAHVYDWTNDWTLGRWAEASGASHYRSANKYIRKIRRAFDKAGQ